MKCVILGLVIVLVLSCASGLSAQKITGNLESRILDEEGNGISFVTVSVTSPDLQGTRIALSGSDGAFLLPNLPIGKYTVTISHVSYEGISFENVTVWLGKTTTMPDIQLTTQLHEAPEIVVTETMPVIDINTTTNALTFGYANPTRALAAKLDEVAIYNTALSAARVLAHYNAR